MKNQRIKCIGIRYVTPYLIIGNIYIKSPQPKFLTFEHGFPYKMLEKLFVVACVLGQTR